MLSRALRGIALSGIRCLASVCKQTYSDEDLPKSAQVFAPHPDDETLGCGGTIIRKSQAAARIGIVYLTSGGASHDRFMDRKRLGLLRREEAVQAAKALGVDEKNLTFLDYPECRLRDRKKEAVPEVAALLSERRPEEVYIPYRHDFLDDHCIAREIVLEALRDAGLTTTVYEYPIWFRAQWPWVAFRKNEVSPVRRSIRRSLTSGLRALRDLRVAVPISDLLDRKGAALACHRSQMEQLVPEVEWPTLKDLGNGEFLACFFGKEEVFRRYQFRTRQ